MSCYNHIKKHFTFVYFIILIISSYPQTNSINNQFKIADEFSSNLPIIVINTNGQTIIDEERIVAHMGVIDNGLGIRNNLTDSFNNYDGRIAIELRGSSSSTYAKPQYRIETQDTAGDDLNVALLGLPKESDWILNGPYNDKSLLRNVVSYNLSNKMGWYASRTVYCELFVNEEYLGLYILMEKLKRDKNRVNIAKCTSSDTSGIDLTGGYIIKIDKEDGENIGGWESTLGTLFQYHYPKPDKIVDQQKLYIKNWMDEFEYIMSTSGFADSLTGYPKYININSFVDHLIINEFCKNVDAYRISAFLFKNRDDKNEKLFAGPIWDFNLTFGDAWNEEDINIAEGWQLDYSTWYPDDSFVVPFWWPKLAHEEKFALKVRERWNDLRKSLLSTDSLFFTIDSISTYIEEARIRNFEKWNYILTGSYDDEILRLKGWIIRRLNWIDENIPLLTDVNNFNNGIVNKIHLYQNFPNPFNPTTTIKYSIPLNVKTQNTVSQHIQLKVYDILGNEVKTLVNQKQTPGSYQVIFNSYPLSSGIYYYTLKTGKFIQTKKLIILK